MQFAQLTLPAPSTAAAHLALQNEWDRKYHTWTPEECHAKECLSLQARAGLIVDLEAVKQLLHKKLPSVLAGRGVWELREPWPEAV